MPNKKINALDVRTAMATDLMLVGDPSTGTAYKSTLATLPLVPYTGATGAVNLGAYDLTVNGLTVGKGNSSLTFNTVAGIQAGLSFTTATASTAIGYNSLKLHSTGNWNTAIGYLSMAQDIDGIGNTAIGTTTLANLSTGANTGNTAIGINSLNRLTSGSYNTQIGYGIVTSGILTSGSYNTLIGAQINVGVASLSNNIILADGQGNIRFRDDATSTILSRLQGTGTRIVLSDTNGALSTTPTGTTLQYVDGTGALQTFPTIMQASDIIAEVRNQSGATMTKGTIVYISGATGNKPLISKALATGDSTSAQTFGLVQTDIANNATGYIVIIGNITDLDTSALTEGQQLYLSGTTAGTWTTTKPYAPIHLVYVGIVIRSHPTQGTISVKIQNGYELDEIHNVAAQTPSNNDGLFYESSTSLWKNKSIATILGYTPQAALTLTTTGTSGAATLVGSTLNIPQYSGGGGGSMAIGGAITSATAGSVLFAGASGVLQQDNANFFWDRNNTRLGIGTTTPGTKLHVVVADNNYINTLLLQNTSTGSAAYTGIGLQDASGNVLGGFQYIPNTFVNTAIRNTVIFASTGLSKLALVANSAGISSTAQDIYFQTLSARNNMYIYGATGNVVIQNGGTYADAGYRLDVNGTARVSGKLTITAGTTAASQINLASSTAPTSPNNGDIWFDGTDLKMRIGGVTKTFTLV